MTVRGPSEFDPKELEIDFDAKTGLALQTPASLQGDPGWWQDRPEDYARLQMLRKERGIVVEDFPRGTDRLVYNVPKLRKMGERLA